MTEVAEITAVIRDILLISVFAVILIVILLLYLKVAALFKSVKRTVETVEEAAAAISEKLVKPATANAGLASGLGKAAAFLFGFGRNRAKDKAEQAKEDGNG